MRRPSRLRDHIRGPTLWWRGAGPGGRCLGTQSLHLLVDLRDAVRHRGGSEVARSRGRQVFVVVRFLWLFWGGVVGKDRGMGAWQLWPEPEMSLGNLITTVKDFLVWVGQKLDGWVDGLKVEVSSFSVSLL